MVAPRRLGPTLTKWHAKLTQPRVALLLTGTYSAHSCLGYDNGQKRWLAGPRHLKLLWYSQQVSYNNKNHGIGSKSNCLPRYPPKWRLEDGRHYRSPTKRGRASRQNGREWYLSLRLSCWKHTQRCSAPCCVSASTGPRR